MKKLNAKMMFVLTLVAALLMIGFILWPRNPQLPQASPIMMPKTSLLRVRPPQERSMLATAALFNPERNALTNAANQAAAPPPPLPELTGIIRSLRGEGIAVIRKSDGTQAFLKTGQALEGWRLIGVLNQSVVLVPAENASSNQQQSIALKREVMPPAQQPQSVEGNDRANLMRMPP
jgi:hypothetical protein